MTMSYISAALRGSCSGVFPEEGQGTSPRHPWRVLRPSCLLKEHGWKGLLARISLAYRSQRCDTNSKIMQGVLVLHHVSPYPALGAPDDPHHLAVQHMGCESSGDIQKGTRVLDPPTRRGR
jgi:hypothetical protein